VPVELLSVEFKEAQPFDVLKYKIVKAIMAMANQRDGGLIIIGVRERKRGVFIREGLSDDVAASYSHETLYKLVCEYASPPPEIMLFMMEYDARRYVIVSVRPCERAPVISRKSTPPSVVGRRDKITVCDINVRAGAPIQTQRVCEASMLDDVLRAAAGRRAAEMVRTMMAGGAFEGVTIAAPRFDQEVADIADLI
jgi:predicted HTH transcriptional regulator